MQVLIWAIMAFGCGAATIAGFVFSATLIVEGDEIGSGICFAILSLFLVALTIACVGGTIDAIHGISSC